MKDDNFQLDLFSSSETKEVKPKEKKYFLEVACGIDHILYDFDTDKNFLVIPYSSRDEVKKRMAKEIGEIKAENIIQKAEKSGKWEVYNEYELFF